MYILHTQPLIPAIVKVTYKDGRTHIARFQDCRIARHVADAQWHDEAVAFVTTILNPSRMTAI